MNYGLGHMRMGNNMCYTLGLIVFNLVLGALVMFWFLKIKERNHGLETIAYEMYTDGIHYRIKKHYTNWRGKQTWKWVTWGDGSAIIEGLSEETIKRTLDVIKRINETENHGWRKVEEK